MKQQQAEHNERTRRRFRRWNMEQMHAWYIVCWVCVSVLVQIKADETDILSEKRVKDEWTN